MNTCGSKAHNRQGAPEMMVEHFRDLRIYQLAFESAMQIFELSGKWPKEEAYSLASQIRRSSRGVCANIAEAWRKRRYIAHFVSKLTDADSEAAETETWLSFALGCGYLLEADFRGLYRNYEGISGGLVKMMTDPQRWCGPAGLLKEEQGGYEISP